MGKTLADGYLELRIDPSKLNSETRAAFKAIGFKAKGQQAGRDMGDGLGKGFADRAGTFSRVIATAAAKMTLIGGAAAAATPGLVHLGAALAPAAGAVVALPAALGAAKAAMATFKIATDGVGKAITAGLTGTAKQAEAALKGLPPAAQRFSRSIIGLKPQIDALKSSVAQRFFLPLQNDIKPLADLYLPLLRTRMANLAGPLGGLGEQFAHTAQQAGSLTAVDTLLLKTRLSVINLRGAVNPLVGAFAALIRTTASFLPGLAAGFADVAQKVGAYVKAAANSGAIADVFRNAVSTLKDLGGIALNVGRILGSVFAAATAGGSSLLGNVRSLTGQVAAFLSSAQGGAALSGLFGTLAKLGQAMRTGLGAVLPAVATSVRALAPAVGNLAPVFAQLVVAVAPLLPYFTQLLVGILNRLVPALASFANWLNQNQGFLKVFVGVLGGTVLAIKAYEIYTKAAAIATGIWTLAQKAAAVAAKVWAAGQWLLNAALSANPIGLVVVALGALVAGVILAYKHSETFRSIVQAAWQGIQTAVSVAWNTVIKPVVNALVSFFRGVIAPAALYLWHNVFQPVFTGIGFVVKAAWVVIQIALKAFQLYLTNVVFPVVKFLYANVVKPVFAAIGAAITFWWNNVARPVFNLAKAAFAALGSALSVVWTKVLKPTLQAFGNFLQNYVAPAFAKGVGLIKTAWEKIRDAAKVPVAFVVNKVINPLIGGINTAASFVGVKDRIPKITGFARGGQIPGAPSVSDNRLAMGPNGLLQVASGEFVTNTRSTLANLPLLKAVNAKQGKVSRDDLDPYLDGYAKGGRIGDGIGGFFDNLLKGAKGAASAVLHPKQAVTKVANAALARIPGGGQIVSLVKGMGKRLIDGIGSYLGSKFSGGGLGGASVLGGYRGMERLIAGRFPNLHVISDYRPGARTLSGNASYHGAGRAVDYPPVRALAAWIKSTFGAKTKELITPWQDLNLHNGAPHTYTGAIWNQHNFAGGNAHVHWAARHGGLIGPRTGGLPLFDNGGTLMPGINTVYNGLGRPEPLVRAGGGETHFHFHGPVASKQAAKTMVLDAYTDLKRERKIP
jgi:phage-related protein